MIGAKTLDRSRWEVTDSICQTDSRSSHNWQTHPSKGGPMTLKKHAIRTHSFVRCLPRRSESAKGMLVDVNIPIPLIIGSIVAAFKKVGQCERGTGRPHS